MRFITYQSDGGVGVAVKTDEDSYRGLLESQAGFPGDLKSLLAQGEMALLDAGQRLLDNPPLDMRQSQILPPIPNPDKIICVGLNYADHTAESPYDQPDYPTIFPRYASTLVGHDAAIVRPRVSEQLDYEGELVAVIGTGGRNISRAQALEHVAGYALFNDASVRDYQFKSPQWTMGKNFDSTGAFGPELVTTDELPPGCRGLRLTTRLNGDIVQDAPIDDLLFDVATLIDIVSEVMTLTPGDLLVTGTPAGVGFARKPPLWMRPGDSCEIEVRGIGLLRNPVIGEE